MRRLLMVTVMFTVLLTGVIIGACTSPDASSVEATAVLDDSFMKVPTFLKVGEKYHIGISWTDFKVEVVSLGEDGWIKVKDEGDDAEFQEAWLNLNQAYIIIEISKEP